MAKACRTRRRASLEEGGHAAEQMLGAAASGEAGLEQQLGTGRPPSGRGAKKGQQHLGPHASAPSRPTERSSEAPTPGHQARAAAAARSPTARELPDRAAVPVPAEAGHSPVIRHHDGVEQVLLAGHGGRSARLGPGAPSRALPPPTREAPADDPLPKRRNSLPAAAARGRPGKDGARQGPARAGAGSQRVRGGGAGRSWAGTQPRPPPLPPRLPQ